MPQQAKASKSKPHRRLKEVLSCGLAGSRSKKAGSKETQGTIKPLSAQAAKPLQSARVPRQTRSASGQEPDRPAIIPKVPSPAAPEPKPKIVRRPTPIPDSSPYSSRAASIRTPSNQKVPQNVVPMAAQPMPGSWDSESSQDTFHETVAARTPSSTGNNRSTSSGGNRKPPYTSSSTYKPISYSRPAQTYSSATYTSSYVPSYDYSSSHYGGHSSGGGWGGDGGGGSSGGGGSCGGGGSSGGGGDGGGGGGGC